MQFNGVGRLICIWGLSFLIFLVIIVSCDFDTFCTQIKHSGHADNDTSKKGNDIDQDKTLIFLAYCQFFFSGVSMK